MLFWQIYNNISDLHSPRMPKVRDVVLEVAVFKNMTYVSEENIWTIDFR